MNPTRTNLETNDNRSIFREERIFEKDKNKRSLMRSSSKAMPTEKIMDLKVNSDEWASLGGDEQEKIKEIVGAFFQSATIVPDAATPPSQSQIKSFNIKNPFCEIACTTAEAAAIAACAALANPIAIAACVAAAKAAGDHCRSRC